MGFNTRTGATAPTTTQGRSFTATAQQSTAVQPIDSSVPVEIDSMDGQHLVVSFDDVKNFICKEATFTECRIFLETCRQYHLNPFTREAYLIHYDNKNDDSPCTIVLGKTCYLKMAENHPQYDGFEAGVIVLNTEAGELIHREGSIVYQDETLLGGWAKVYRKDRSRPFYEEVNFEEYNTKKSIWTKSPATMIRKVALTHALREAFPSTFGNLYDESEVDVDVEAQFREVEDQSQIGGSTQRRKLNKPAKKEEPAPLAVESGDSDEDPFHGDGE